jgi:hypothetical protein
MPARRIHSVSDKHLVAAVLTRLTEAMNEWSQDVQSQSEYMRDFWLTLPAEEAEAWRRCLLKPGWWK